MTDQPPKGEIEMNSAEEAERMGKAIQAVVRETYHTMISVGGGTLSPNTAMQCATELTAEILRAATK